jgi:hypothetical protein
MQYLTSERKRQQLEWRRAKVLELSSHGYSEREIAERLAPLAPCTVHRDLVYVRKQAQSNLEHHIHEVIPMELERCMVGIKANLKHVLEIAESVSDPRTKLQARAIATDIYKYIMDLATNGAIVTDAMNRVTQIQKDVKVLNRLDESIKADEEEMTTTNGVF